MKKQEIKMTVPVTVTEKSGNMTMQFYLPSKFNKENVPNPISPEVEVINIIGGYYAVIRYSGRASDDNFIKHKNILQDELSKDNIKIISPPIKATYNSPFTLPMMRKMKQCLKWSTKSKINKKMSSFEIKQQLLFGL